MSLKGLEFGEIISAEQIDFIRDYIQEDNEVRFVRSNSRMIPDGRYANGFHVKKDSEEIRGVVAKKYKNIFILTDGRSFTYVDYILGNLIDRDLARTLHPIRKMEKDTDRNYYGYRNTKYVR